MSTLYRVYSLYVFSFFFVSRQRLIHYFFLSTFSASCVTAPLYFHFSSLPGAVSAPQGAAFLHHRNGPAGTLQTLLLTGRGRQRETTNRRAALKAFIAASNQHQEFDHVINLPSVSNSSFVLLHKNNAIPLPLSLLSFIFKFNAFYFPSFPILLLTDTFIFLFVSVFFSCPRAARHSCRTTRRPFTPSHLTFIFS